MENIAAEETGTLLPWLTGDGFMLVVVIMFAIIMIVFAQRLNRLDNAINTLNTRLDNLASTLVAISNRPCQLESHGFSVEITDPTGKKLEQIKNCTSN